MKIINARYEILTPVSDYGIKELQLIEKIGRVCYKSEDKITEDGLSARKFIKMLIERGHEAMLEHSFLSVRFIVDRGISHEIVRHRIASFAQESTRYCNYGHKGEITVILPLFFDTGMGINSNSIVFEEWKQSCEVAERKYISLLEKGATPQEARSVLPNSLKTEVIMSANYREWRNFFKLRTAKTAHPQMREVTIPLLKELQEKIPVIFDDIPIV